MRFYILMDHGTPNEVTSSRESYEKWIKHHEACSAIECNTETTYNAMEYYNEKIKQLEKTIYELNCANLNKTEIITDKERALDKCYMRIEQLKTEKTEAVEKAIKELCNNGSYLEGFKEGIEWLNGVLKK